MNTRRWATSEELMLACAVDRRGAEDWDSIAVEVQRRCFEPPFSLSPQDCRRKFNDLKRRFMFHDHDDSASLMPMVDELKRIRVEELRREVQRRDGLIMLLELKVKRLEEERERSVKEESATDPINNRYGRGRERKLSTSISAGTSVSGEDTDDREKRSFHESNSSKKGEGEQNGITNDQMRLEPVEPIRNEPEPVRTDSETERKWPFIGDSNIDSNIEENEHGASESRTDGLGDTKESLESDGESEGEENEEEEEKDSKNPGCNLQSSVSLSRRKRRRRCIGAAATRSECSSGDEREGDELSPAIKRASVVQSGPLVKLLEIISSHQLGSWIERRLQSQESKRYKSLIRQHMDLQIVKSRLDKGIYSNSNIRFFRDLLLLYNNVIVFFHRSSKEFEAAALELRALVMKEMTDNLKIQQPVSGKFEPKQEPPHDLPRSSKTPTLVACFKQGSSKVLSDNGGGKGEEKGRDIIEKTDGSFVEISEKGTRTKRSKVSVTKSKNGYAKNEYGGNELSSHDSLETKNGKKGLTAKQKQDATRFLKRMKRHLQGEDSENELVKGLEEEKKGVNRKGEGKRGRGRGRGSRKRELGREVSREVKRGKGSQPNQCKHRVAEIQKGERETAAAAVAVRGGSRPRKRLRRQ